VDEGLFVFPKTRKTGVAEEMDENMVNAALTNNRVSVIFDMDGVIVDSASFHYLTWRTLLQKRGITYSYEQFADNFGRRTDLQVKRILGEITEAEITAFVKEKDNLFREIVGTNVTAFPGVVELIKSLKQSGRKIAVGSSSPAETVNLITKTIGVKDDFDAIVTGSEVTEGKPSPQIFLTAARKLSADPVKCIVIEDAMVGVTAAKRARMRAVAVTNTHPREKFGEADLVVDSLKELTVVRLESLLNPLSQAPVINGVAKMVGDGIKLS
jgi:beta-phosphoglucomutase family hydrolase